MIATTVKPALILSALALLLPGVAAAHLDRTHDSQIIAAGGVRMHCLDFGGEGLPLVLVHSEAWDAYTYKGFAPRFANQNRVLAVTRPGYGESEAHADGFDVATQAGSLIDFLDALEIERAVFAGNASATAELTFLGEHHADRVAGLIYFTGLAVPWLKEHDSDPTLAFEMFRRASPGAGDAVERERARKAYRPEHLRADQPTIPVPALAFVARSGTMANERGIGALALVGSPLLEDVRSQMSPSPVRDHLERLARDESYRTGQLEQIADPEAREYFLRLASDPELQERMLRYHEEVVLPALREAQARFRRAFADSLRLVRLDVDQVVGYEYRDAPELIEPHVRRFLEEVADPSPHEVRYVTVAPGVELEVLEWGGEGPALVFLAGLTMNAHAFDDFAPRFTDSHRAIGITRRGHGASSWPDDGYSLERRVEDIRVVLDSLGVERVVFGGHSLAGKEITRFASEYPDRVDGLVYIDAAHDPPLIESLRISELCPSGPEILEAIERRFEDSEGFRRTQRREAPDGTLGPFVSDTALTQLIAGFSAHHDYSAVRAPALAVYHTPRRIEDVFGGEGVLSQACVTAMQRYIYEGIAGFAVGMERGRIVALDDSQHNVHLVSPDALEEVMRRWMAELQDEQ